MKKLFISQPMRDKTDEEILIEREKAVKVAKEILNEDVEVIDSFFQEAPHDASHWYIVGKTLELLTYADVAFFSTGWEMDTGCRIEHICANEYGIRIIRKMDTKENNTLTKSDIGDIKTHLLQVQGYYRKSLNAWEQLMSKMSNPITILNDNLKYSSVVENVKVLRELDQNVEQLLKKKLKNWSEKNEQFTDF